MDIAKEWETEGLKLERSVPLAPLTTWKIGGEAAYFFRAGSADHLAKAKRLAEDLGLKIFVMGSGSNILVSDAGFEGLVVKMELNTVVRDGEKIITGAEDKTAPVEEP